ACSAAGPARARAHRLAACVDCHAAPAAEQARNGVGAGEAPAFCASCHDYAGVQAGCFQCHSNERGAR
ncbi:cytochrome c3 family protein, partial [Halorhodospira neutriphila]|nr:hypothetical protein [Halorhodospira neutriphila]